MKPLTLKFHYDQFASHVKPDEWIGFCWWVRHHLDNLTEIEGLIRSFAQEADEEDRESWSEDTLGFDVEDLIRRMAEQDDEDDSSS